MECAGIAGPTDISHGSQNYSTTWKLMRRILITPSVFKSFMTERTGDALTKFVYCHLWVIKDFDNKALQYGLKIF